MNAIKDKKIAIVGGGPGGLTLARLLQMKGADITIYERDEHKDARPKGATLDLHEESGLAALGEAGLTDAFYANYRPGADKMRITDKHAHVFMDDHINDHPNINRPEIDRGPLQNILLDSLQPGTVIWGKQFVSLIADGAGWKIEFKDGSIASAAIVIAADGAKSKLRPYITPIKPFFAGMSAIEGAVYNSATACPEIHQLLGDGKIFAMGDDKTLIVSSKGDGSLVFYPGFKTTENWAKESGIDFSDKVQVTNWFKETYKGWDNIWLQLFENAATPFIPRPQYCMPLDQSWDALPNLTMLGDAAHLMPPYAGEGVNMAMQDALELSHCLTGDEYPDVQCAIAAYETQMRARASAMAKETLEQTESLHSPDALKNMLTMFEQEHKKG